MGTRNLTAVMKDGEYKIAQYGQWDGYPNGQGITALTFLRDTNLDEFKAKLDNLSFYTEKEYQQIIDEHTDNGSVAMGSDHDKWWQSHMAQTSRDRGAEILNLVMNHGATKLKNSIGFAGDSLFCEWAYIVDFDKGTFEVFQGFNKTPIKEGRFVSGDDSLEKEADYEPIQLKKTYQLSSLPTDEQFLADLTEDED